MKRSPPDSHSSSAGFVDCAGHGVCSAVPNPRLHADDPDRDGRGDDTVTRRDVAAGEELTGDYRASDVDSRDRGVDFEVSRRSSP